MKSRNRTCPYCGATLDPGEKCNCVSNIIDLDLFIPEPDEKGKKLSQYELYLKWRQREALKVKTSCGVNIS